MADGLGWNGNSKYISGLLSILIHVVWRVYSYIDGILVI